MAFTLDRLNYVLDFDISKFREKVNQSVRDFNRMGEAAAKNRQEFSKMTNSLLPLGAAIGAATAGFFAFRGIIQGVFQHGIRLNMEFQTMNARLTTMFQSAGKAKQVLDEFRVIAEKTPFSIREISSAGVTLSGFLGEARKDIVPFTKMVADLGAQFGGTASDLHDATSALGRAWTAGRGGAEMLRERGTLPLIDSVLQLKMGLSDVTKATLPQFRQALLTVLTDTSFGIKGATDLISKTAAGGVSNLGDAWDNFTRRVTEGAMPAYQRGTQSLIQVLDKATKRLIGEGGLEAAANKVADALERNSGRMVDALVKVVEGIGNLSEKIANFDLQKMKDMATTALSLFTAFQGAKAGAAIGKFFGPAGTVVGLFTGGLVGLAAGESMGAKVTGRKNALQQLTEELFGTKEDSIPLAQRQAQRRAEQASGMVGFGRRLTAEEVRRNEQARGLAGFGKKPSPFPPKEGKESGISAGGGVADAEAIRTAAETVKKAAEEAAEKKHAEFIENEQVIAEAVEERRQALVTIQEEEIAAEERVREEIRKTSEMEQEEARKQRQIQEENDAAAIEQFHVRQQAAEALAEIQRKYGSERTLMTKLAAEQEKAASKGVTLTAERIREVATAYFQIVPAAIETVKQQIVLTELEGKTAENAEAVLENLLRQGIAQAELTGDMERQVRLAKELDTLRKASFQRQFEMQPSRLEPEVGLSSPISFGAMLPTLTGVAAGQNAFAGMGLGGGRRKSFKETLTGLIRDSKQVQATFQQMGLSAVDALGRINSKFQMATTFANSFFKVNEKGMLAFTAGGGILGAVNLGLSLLVGWYQRATEASRRAKEEQIRHAQELRDAYRQTADEIARSLTDAFKETGRIDPVEFAKNLFSKHFWEVVTTMITNSPGFQIFSQRLTDITNQGKAVGLGGKSLALKELEEDTAANNRELGRIGLALRNPRLDAAQRRRLEKRRDELADMNRRNQEAMERAPKTVGEDLAIMRQAGEQLGEEAGKLLGEVVPPELLPKSDLESQRAQSLFTAIREVTVEQASAMLVLMQAANDFAARTANNTERSVGLLTEIRDAIFGGARPFAAPEQVIIPIAPQPQMQPA